MEKLMSRNHNKTKQVKVVDVPKFEANVFGGHCFLSNFPEITTTGVTVRHSTHYGRNCWHVIENDVRVHDTSFFTEEEMVYLEEVKPEVVENAIDN